MVTLRQLYTVFGHDERWRKFATACTQPMVAVYLRNGIMLCHKCHKEVHCNPWRNIELMKAKAEELGIDIKERYDYGEECNQD